MWSTEGTETFRYSVSFAYRSNGCICSPFAAFDADTGTSAISATKEFGLPEQSSCRNGTK